MTFKDLYEEWSERAFKTASEATISADRAAFNACAPLHDKIFIDLKAKDFQYLFDTTDKNHPTMRKMKILISKMYKYAMKYDYVSKDYSQYIDISQYKDKNPNQYDRQKFKYDNYHKKRFQPLMEQLGMDHTPHCCRYTCSSMMHKAEIRETIRKKILGHSQDLINDTYTQLDIDEIVNAINLI